MTWRAARASTSQSGCSSGGGHDEAVEGADGTARPAGGDAADSTATESTATPDEDGPRASTDVGGLGLRGGDEIEGDGHYSITRWESDDGMVLDSIEHDYGGQAVLGGHCIPGGEDVPGGANNFGLNATTCTTDDPKLNWGEYVLQWFIDHPRRK